MLRIFHKDNDVLVKNKFYLELLKRNSNNYTKGQQEY